MVTLGESNYGALATLEPDYLRGMNDEHSMHREGAEADQIGEKEKSAAETGSVFAWRLKGLKKRA